MALDLLDSLTFYGQYHHNRWNQLIHFIFVPAIMATLLMFLLLAYNQPLLPAQPLQSALQGIHVPATIAKYAVPNIAALVVAVYSGYYILLDPVAGLSWALCCGVPMWLGATAAVATNDNAWQWALGIHLLSWYMQIHPGHGLLEGRKPALMDSLVQALSLAPLFVWFELLFLLGYRPQLYAALQRRITSALKDHRAAQGKARAKAS